MYAAGQQAAARGGFWKGASPVKSIAWAARNLSLRAKLQLSILLLMILPMVLIFAWLGRNNRQVAVQQQNENHLQVLKQTEYTLNSLLTEVDLLSLSLLDDDQVQALGKGGGNADARTGRELFISLQSVIKENPYINSVCISTAEGIAFQYGDLVEREAPRFQEKALELRGRAFWTDTYPLEDRLLSSGDPYVMSYIRVITDTTQYYRPIAFQRISVDERQLSALVNGVADRVSGQQNGHVLLLSAEGRVLSAWDSALIGQSFSACIPDYQRMTQAREGFFSTRFGQEEHALMYYTLEGTGWQVVQVVPWEQFERQMGNDSLFPFIAILLCVLFAVVFSRVLQTTVVVPLQRLAGEMERVSEGDFRVGIRAETRDEIGRLTNLYIDMVGRLNTLIETVYRAQINEKDAALTAMESQINPHFLYNTLDSIHWLAVKNHDYEVSEQVEALADIFRHVLNRGEQVTTVAHEVEHLKSYLVIQKSRMGERVRVQLHIAPGLEDYLCPKLILQPLVENAINHGLRDTESGGLIRVEIRREGGFLHFVVIDNGMGTDEEEIERMLRSDEASPRIFALKNVNDRIRLRFGEECRLQLYSIPGQGTRVEVTIRAEHEGEGGL